MQMELNDLYRSFEDLESRIDEFDSMTEKDFIEEEEIMIEKITNIEDSFSEFIIANLSEFIERKMYG